MEKIKRGTVREDGLVFLKNHFDKQIWLTREKYDSYAETYKNYITKRMMDHRSNGKKWKIGDFNPENGLYFLRTNSAYRPIFGTLEQLVERRRKISEKTSEYWKIRKPFVRIRKRGDIDPILNLIFWRYNCRSGTEIWLTPNKFKVAWEKSKESRKNAPKKKTGNSESQG